MTTLINITGWMILGLSIAWMICARKKTSEETKESSDEAMRADSRDETSSDSLWCETIENLASCASICFDGSLKITAAGPAAMRILGVAERDRMISRHLMDIIPANAAPAFLDGVVMAMREGAKKWNAVLGDKKVNVKAIAMDNKIILVIEEILP